MIWKTLSVSTAALCLVSSLLVAQEPRAAVAAVSVGAIGVDFAPSGNFERYVLTVSGPGDLVVRQEFSGGKTPSFGLFDADGQRLPDGHYTYELQAVPRVPRALQQQVAEAREKGDTAAIEALVKSGKLPQGGVQSGHFAIHGGAFVPATLVEPKPARPAKKAAAASSGLGHVGAADVVTADDAIIQGSLCVGLDCVNNESFGFDTIRLKENNTRIVFMDTSTATGFPTHDWQLTANDSASGGAEKFSIEDLTAATVPFTITGSAPTNSVFVDSTGRVGFGTSTPVLFLHENKSDTPSLRFEQNASGGFTAQTWDVAGNEANFFVRDVTGGSRLPLRIRPGAPTSSIDINASGMVGFGTASPETLIDARATGTARLMVTAADDAQTVEYILRRSRGTNGAPTAIQSSDNFGAIGFRGYDGSGFSADQALISVAAEETWTSTAHGSRMLLATTTPGTTSNIARIVIKGDGKVGIGNTAPAQAL
ncbi:MAG TPA: hypothetical protein VGE98_12445, partial [Thermoanaerobaculia bacterium]